jgi:hypothetical protein
MTCMCQQASNTVQPGAWCDLHMLTLVAPHFTKPNSAKAYENGAMQRLHKKPQHDRIRAPCSSLACTTVHHAAQQYSLASRLPERGSNGRTPRLVNTMLQSTAFQPLSMHSSIYLNRNKKVRPFRGQPEFRLAQISTQQCQQGHSSATYSCI